MSINFSEDTLLEWHNNLNGHLMISQREIRPVISASCNRMCLLALAAAGF